MKLSSYIKDKLINIIVFILFYIFMLLLFRISNIGNIVYIMFTISYVLLGLFLLLYDYFRKNKFYKRITNTVKELDKAYLVLETLDEPSFYDGKLLYELLYDINKSMIDNISSLEHQTNDFKEYIEMWIHEVKIPLASISLIIHNNKDKFDDKIIDQIRKIDNYVEQVLYYSRSDNTEKDYMITSIKLDKIVNKVLLNNKDTILNNNIELKVEDLSYTVKTDTKWLEFIINQIISNSIKYKKKNKDSYIKIYAEENNKLVNLYIEDNGIGIDSKDIKRVFDKSFTGSNGRASSVSTGMGLYIVNKLCNKLGHKVNIESKKNEYTRVSITFNNNTIYDVLS